MKFQSHKTPEPEINLIPFIDVLLVVLIFLNLLKAAEMVMVLNLILEMYLGTFLAVVVAEDRRLKKAGILQ